MTSQLLLRSIQTGLFLSLILILDKHLYDLKIQNDIQAVHPYWKINPLPPPSPHKLRGQQEQNPNSCPNHIWILRHLNIVGRGPRDAIDFTLERRPAGTPLWTPVNSVYQGIPEFRRIGKYNEYCVNTEPVPVYIVRQQEDRYPQATLRGEQCYGVHRCDFGHYVFESLWCEGDHQPPRFNPYAGRPRGSS